MSARAALAACLFLTAAFGAALAGQPPPPQPPQPPRVGETLKVCEEKPEGTVSGWLRRAGGVRFQICVEKITGDNKKPGESFDVMVRSQKVDGKDKFEDADVAVFRRFAPGDRVEVEWFKDDNRARAASIKLTRLMPRQGAVAGKVVGRDKDNTWFNLEVTAPPQGAEDLKGQTLNFAANWVRNPDTKDRKRAWIPSPEQLKLFEALETGDLLEVAYKCEGSFRADTLKKTGRAEGEKNPEPRPEPKDPKKEPKKDPPPEKKPPPDDDF